MQIIGLIGGEGGIRTLGEISPTLPFQGSSIGRSDTSPHKLVDQLLKRFPTKKGVGVTLEKEK